MRHMNEKETTEWLQVVRAAKPEQYRNMMDGLFSMTSDSGASVKIEIYDQGQYITVEGCRRALRVWINTPSYTVGRKPKLQQAPLDVATGAGYMADAKEGK